MSLVRRRVHRKVVMYVHRIIETFPLTRMLNIPADRPGRSLWRYHSPSSVGSSIDGTFVAMFGGDKFVPIIGHLSLARDMKTALQEDEDGEATTSTGQKKIMSSEEKAQKDEKNQKVIAEVCNVCCDIFKPRLPNAPGRKRKSEKNASPSSWKHSHASLVYSQSRLPASTMWR